MDQLPGTMKRAMTADDLFRITLVGDPQLSPNGKRVAWTQTRLDKDQDTYQSAIWLANTDGSDARQLTSASHRNTGPTWSPDGTRIAFLSNRPPALDPPPAEDDDADDGEGDADDPASATDRKSGDSGPAQGNKPVNQIWVINIHGGEAQQLTAHPQGADQPAWSPDCRLVAFVGHDDVRQDDGFYAPMSNGGVADERIIRDVRYRGDGSGFIERFAHLWIADVDTADMRQVTTGIAFDSSPAWSPDGSAIAFEGNRDFERMFPLNATTIFTVPSTGGEVTALAPADAAFGSPVWSPDGKRIAFVGHEDARAGSRNDTLWTVGANGMGRRNHTGNWDVSIGDSGMSDVITSASADPVWKDDDSVFVLASVRSETQVYEIPIDNSTGSNDIRQVTTGDYRVAGFTSASGQLAWLQGAFDRPFEVFTSRMDDTKPVQVSTCNKVFVDKVELLNAEELEVRSPDGKLIQAWLIPPRGLDRNQGTKHPLILQIHGGPHAMYAKAMFHEMQLMAARGYGVLFCNPRGSAGYGEAFTTCTRGVWGESDMPDVIAAVDTALDQDWVDPDRLGITGGSYGGYLTNWIIGHDTRFRAAVTQRCVSNFHSFFGTSDIGTTFGAYEFDGVPWKDPDTLLRHSPISYVDRIETPLLILHSEQDLRCPIEQAEQMFAALKYLGKDVSFIRFPEESHELSRSGTPS